MQDLELKDKQNRCFICERPKWEDDCDEGFGFIHKSLLTYDPEDILDYENEKGCLVLCNKCDDYFKNPDLDNKYLQEKKRIEISLKFSNERFSEISERLKAIKDLPLPQENKYYEKLIKMLELEHRIFISAVEWLGLPKYHVKIKRYLR